MMFLFKFLCLVCLYIGLGVWVFLLLINIEYFGIVVCRLYVYRRIIWSRECAGAGKRSIVLCSGISIYIRIEL